MNQLLPDLSHYYGRKVEKVEQYAPADPNEPAWALVLEGGVVIQNYDPTMPVPGQHIVGKTFTNTTLSGKVTSLFFGGLGGNTVSLNPTKYAIVGIGADKPFFPQATEQGDAKYDVYEPPPHPDERIAEGPDESFEA